MSRFYTLFFLQIALLFSSFPSDALEYYQCHFKKDESLSIFDKFVTISETESGKLIHTDYFGRLTLTTVEKKDHFLITVYSNVRDESRNNDHFYIFQFNTLNNELDIGNGYHASIKAFEKAYLMPYNRKNFQSLNLNPELIVYLPKKRKSDFISYAFLKSKYYCKPLSRLNYHRKKLVNILLSILSA